VKRAGAPARAGAAGGGGSGRGAGFKDDDGSMYNPFAEAFKNMKKKG
jgi:hypothetical protein